MASINLQGDTSGSISISAPSVAGTNTLTLPASTETLATQNSLGVRNLIINGDMQIAQRATSVAGIGAGYYTVDRWTFPNKVSAGTWTQSQDTDAPTGQGFSNSLKMQCTTSASLSATTTLELHQVFEGQNCQYLKKGTANAESLTLSFWVKTNKTGTYAISLIDNDNTRHIGANYTVSSADTWEKIIITFVGDTTGVLDNDNNASFRVIWHLANGSDVTSGTADTTWVAVVAANRAVGQTVNLADTVSNYINITGVQLEVGTEATPFEHRPYDMELARCQRYYYQWDTTSANNFLMFAMAANTTALYGNVKFPTTMRSNPGSIIYGSGWGWWLGGALTTISAISIAESGTTSVTLNCTTTGVTAEKMYGVLPGGATNYIGFISEL